MFKKIRIAGEKDLSYLLGLKKFIFLITIILLATGVLGYFFIKSDPESTKSILGVFEDLAQKTANLKSYELLILIFLNNGLKILAVAFLGILFGIAPIFFTALNGFLIGMVAFLIQENHSWNTFWLGILPHGIFEIPALIIGSAIGLKLGFSFFKFIRKKGELKAELKRAFLFSFRFILPILLFAAFAEVFISQIIVNIIK